LRSAASAVSLARDAEPTWNPTWVAALGLTARYAATERIWLRGSLAIARELTQSDSTTYADETMLGDASLAAGTTLWRAPTLGLQLGGDLQVGLPTSKASQARSLLASPSLGASLAWSRSRLSASFASRVTRLLHSYTTAGYVKPWLAGCADLASGCDRFSHSGVRNAMWRFSNSLAVGWQPAAWLGFAASAGVGNDLLYDLSTARTADGVAVMASAADPGHRAIMVYGLNATLTVHPALRVGLGAETANSQLAPNSTYQRPFFNRYTDLYIDLQVSPDVLLSSL